MERAVHDRGGWATDEPIDRTEHELADWEMLADALVGALGAGGVTVERMRASAVAALRGRRGPEWSEAVSPSRAPATSANAEGLAFGVRPAGLPKRKRVSGSLRPLTLVVHGWLRRNQSQLRRKASRSRLT